MITIHDVEQGTGGWHALRDDRYTGNGAHKLLRFGAVEYARAKASGFTGNFYTRRGHVLESKAINLFERIVGHSVLRPGFVTNSDYPNCGYSPDAIEGTFKDGAFVNAILIEVKCFNKTRHLAIAGGEIPFEILAQIHFGLFLCDIRKARLILYNPEFAKREIDGQPNPDYDPKKALVILNIRSDKAIRDNFRRILIKEVAHALRT